MKNLTIYGDVSGRDIIKTGGRGRLGGIERTGANLKRAVELLLHLFPDIDKELLASPPISKLDRAKCLKYLKSDDQLSVALALDILDFISTGLS